jgi:GMP synthase (glutamine-hydrolyzing) (EC 6.3.5.2)
MVEPETFIEEAIEEIREQVGDEKAVIALSGGVDSSVAAALAYEAIGDRLIPVYVDTGLMRKGETESIRETFAFMESLRVVEAQDRFFAELEGVTDPEEKRHVIGEQFIREFEREAKEAGADYLVQGTIYPDRIESEGNIKSHHNVGGLPDVVDFEGIVEPVRDLYKDEVREVARALDLEDVVAERMPFPGPGWRFASSAKSRRRRPRWPVRRVTSWKRRLRSTTRGRPSALCWGRRRA